MKKVAIHQPNFFPWLGYFDKIVKSDIFVFLDDVQVVKTGSSWFNRVKIIGPQSDKGDWLTAPIKRPSGVQLIKDTEISDFENWFLKTVRLLQNRYKNYPHQDDVINFFQSCRKAIDQSKACEMNIYTITTLCEKMGLKKDHLIRSSSLNIQTSGTQRLVDITQNCGAEIYLNGGGASEYFEESLFQRVDLRVVSQNFKPYAYSQKNGKEFIPGLSILDLIMNLGFFEAGQMILSKK